MSADGGALVYADDGGVHAVPLDPGRLSERLCRRLDGWSLDGRIRDALRPVRTSTTPAGSAAARPGRGGPARRGGRAMLVA